MLSVDFWNLLATVFNLVILAFLVRIFLFKPVMKIIDARRQEAEKQFEEAAGRQAEADSLKNQYEESLAEIEGEKDNTLKEARKRADAEYQRIVDDARAEAKKIKKDAIKTAEFKKEQIIKGAQKEIADMVVEAAVKVVSGKSGADVDSTLYDEFLNKAGEKGD